MEIGIESGSRRGSVGRRSGFALFAIVARSIQQVSTLVVTLLAARFLGPVDYGVYSLAVVFVLLVQTLTYTGFYHFIVTSRAPDDDVLSTSFWMLTGVATLAALLLVLLARPISSLFGAAELQPVLALLALAQPFAAIGAWYSAGLLRRQQVTLQFGILFCQNLAALVGGVVLLWLWQSLWALVAFRYIRVASGLALCVVLSPLRPRLRFDRALAWTATGFSMGLYGARLLTFLSRYAGDLLLGLSFSTAEAGLYRFGTRVATGATDIVSQPMSAFALSQLGAAARRDRDPSVVMERFCGSITLLIGGVSATIVLLGDDLVAVLFDPAYLAALTVTCAMAVRAVLLVVPSLLEPALAAAGRTGQVLVFDLATTAAVVAAVFAAAPFGLAALAWTQAAVTAGVAVAAMLTIRKFNGIPLRRMVRPTLLAGALVLGYAAALFLVAAVLEHVAPSRIWSLGLALCAALLLGTLTLFLGARLRVFSLGVFSG